MRANVSGSWLRSQSSFGAVKPVSARLPVSWIRRSSPIALLDLCALGRRALVVPEDRRPDDVAALVEDDEPVHLAAVADRGGLDAEVGECGVGGARPVAGILLGPARLRRRERIVALRAGEDLAVSESASALTPLVPTSIPTSASPHESLCWFNTSAAIALDAAVRDELVLFQHKLTSRRAARGARSARAGCRRGRGT